MAEPRKTTTMDHISAATRAVAIGGIVSVGAVIASYRARIRRLKMPEEARKQNQSEWMKIMNDVATSAMPIIMNGISIMKEPGHDDDVVCNDPNCEECEEHGDVTRVTH